MKQIALLLVVIQFAGCAYHRVTLTPQSTEADYQAATSMMENRKATIITSSETKIKAEQLNFKLDSLIFVHLKTNESSTIPLPEVNRVIARNPRPYIRNGAIYGAIPGAALGLIFAAFVGGFNDKCVDCKPNETKWEIILPVSAFTGALFTGSLGALAGAAATPVYTVEYHLNEQSTPSRIK